MKRATAARWWGIVEATWDEVKADRASIVASGVAFRVALALFPALALLTWIASHTVGPGEAKALTDIVSDLLPDASRSVVEGAVRAALRRNPADGGAEAPWLGAFAPVIGLAGVLWAANSGMKALFSALNIVYDEREDRPFLRRTLVTLLFTLGALGLIALAAAVLLATPIVLSHLGLGTAGAAAVHRLRWFALFAGCAPALSLLYRCAPRREPERWPFVTVGSVLAAGLLTLGTALFSWFTERFLGLSVTYGPLSAVVAFLLWLWADFLVVLACAELDSVIERETNLYGRGPGGADRHSASPTARRAPRGHNDG